MQCSYVRKQKFGFENKNGYILCELFDNPAEELVEMGMFCLIHKPGFLLFA